MAEIPNRTLQRGLEMLETLSAHPQGIALCDLTRAMGLPRTTAYNLLQTLVYLGYAVLSPKNGKYVLGSRMFEIGSAWMRDQDDYAPASGGNAAGTVRPERNGASGRSLRQ